MQNLESGRTLAGQAAVTGYQGVATPVSAVMRLAAKLGGSARGSLQALSEIKAANGGTGRGI